MQLSNQEISNSGRGLRNDWTLAALFLLAVLKGADQQMLPASFRAMEHDLHFAPSQLAVLALCQGVAAAVTGPMWGNFVDSGASRKWLLQVGTGLWGICTFLLAMTSNFAMMIVLRVLNGAALAMIVPVVQSMVADLTDSSNCGSTFGKVSCSCSLGQVLACLIVTPISEQHVLGMRGWRFSLASFGVLSLLTIPFVRLAVDEEPRVWKPRRFGIFRELRTMYQFLKIPSFRVIILQGVFGTIPSAAQSFTTMYFKRTRLKREASPGHSLCNPSESSEMGATVQDLIQETATIKGAQPIPVGALGIRLEKCGRVGRSRHRPRPRRSGRRIQEDPGNGRDRSEKNDIDLSEMDVEDVIKVMKAAVGNPQVQQQGFQVLRSKAGDPENHQEVARADGIATVVKAMTEQHESGELQLAGMHVLEMMTSGDAMYTKTMVDANGISAISNAMIQNLSKADLQAVGCNILCNVAKHDAHCQEKVAKSGAAQAVLDAMRAHASNSTIQELGCHALKEFAAFNAESQEDIYMRGGIQAVLRAMETFPDLPNLQVMGCGVLRNLAACNSQQQQAVVSRGGIQVVLDAMAKHKEHSLMQWAGCWTLFCLCVHNAEMRSEVYAYGAARAALKALEAHRLEARVQEAGCWLLKELAQHMASCKDMATFSAAIQASLKAVEKYPGNQAVEKAARTALQKLSAFDKEGWVKMACLGRCGRLGRTATMRTLEAIQE